MENLESLKIDKSLSKLLKVFNKLNFIKTVYRIFQYSDEPKFYQYTAEIIYKNYSGSETDIQSKQKAGGSSFTNEREAFLKCLAEAIERYSSSVYDKKRFLYKKHSEIKNSLDPLKVTSFTKQQRSKYRGFRITSDSIFGWMKCKSLTGSGLYLPSQLIYHTYKLYKNEPCINIPISTGTAFGDDLQSALYRGILEIVERDAFAIMYLNTIKCPKVLLKQINDNRIKTILNIIDRYRLEVHVMDITTDLNIPTFAAVTINRTGIGPAVLIGLKSNLDPLEAILGSFRESLHTRGWLRYLHEENFGKGMILKKEQQLEKRGLYWYDKKKIRYMNFWIQQKESPLRHKIVNPQLSNIHCLKTLISIINNHHYNIYYADVTLPILMKTGFKVVKVVIPELHPHRYNESFKLLGGRRLKEVPIKLGYSVKNKYNTIPHPFL